MKQQKKNRYISYALMYATYNIAMALFAAIISIYLMGIGLSAVQVSLLISISSVSSMVSQPVIGFLQDRFSRKSVTVVMLLISAVTGIIFSRMRSFVPLIIFYSVTSLLMYGANPYIERLAAVCRDYSYKSMRIWGTVGYAVASQAAGIIYDRLSGGSNYYFYFFFIIAAAVSVMSIRTGEAEEGKAEEKKTVGKNYRREVLKNGNFIKYMIVMAMYYGTMNLNYIYLPSLYQSEGVPVTLVTTIMFLSTMMEIPILFLMPRMMKRFHNVQLLTIAFSIAFSQYLLYVLIPVPAVQAAVTFLTRGPMTMIIIMTNMKMITDIVPPAYQMSALTLNSAIAGSLSAIVMQNIGGQIIDRYSIHTLYAFMAGVMAVGLILLYALKIPKGEQRDMFT